MEISTKSWEKRFKREGKIFKNPHPDISLFVKTFKEKGYKRVLDLGCGSGRHTVYLAEKGFKVYGLDNSSTAIQIAKKWLSSKNLSANFQIQEMTEDFPYKNSFFDVVISVQVIHHSNTSQIKGIVKEIERVLKKGGFIFITVPKLKNQGRRFKQIEENTFIPLDGKEKGLLHHYFTPVELKKFFKNFEITDIHIDDVNHYSLSGFKK